MKHLFYISILLISLPASAQKADSLQIYKDSVEALKMDIGFADEFIKGYYSILKEDATEKEIKAVDSVSNSIDKEEELGARLILRVKSLMDMLAIKFKALTRK